MDRKLFGEIVRHARKAKGLTLDALGAKTQMVKGYLCGIENGKVNPPSPARVKRLADHLSLPVDDLLLLSYAAKAPKAIRGLGGYLEFANKIVDSFKEKKLIPP
jgi:transcriptional regulator with XRE-family HTH domain